MLALTFLRMSRKIGGKKKEVFENSQKNTVSEKSEQNCYSFKWAISNSMKAKKVFAANPVYIAIPFILALGSAFILLTMFQSIGYVMLLSFIGMTIFLDSDAFESFGYGKVIIKAPLIQLNEEDQSYMKIAKEVLELATVHFFMVGMVLVVVGPFIREIFDGLTYAIAVYSIAVFSTTEMAATVSPVLALFLALGLPGILLYLPELVGRTLFREMKKLGLIRKMLHGTRAQEELESSEHLPYAPITASRTAITIDSDEPTHGRIIINSHNTVTILHQASRRKNIDEE